MKVEIGKIFLILPVESLKGTQGKGQDLQKCRNEKLLLELIWSQKGFFEEKSQMVLEEILQGIG